MASKDNQDDDATATHTLVSQVLMTLWPDKQACRYNQCPNGMIEVDCDADHVVDSTKVSLLHDRGLQPIVYLSRACIAVAGPNHVPESEARRQRRPAAAREAQKRKRSDDDSDGSDTETHAASRMSTLLRSLCNLDTFACPTVTAHDAHTFSINGLESVVHADVQRATEAWSKSGPPPAPPLPRITYNFALCQIKVQAT